MGPFILHLRATCHASSTSPLSSYESPQHYRTCRSCRMEDVSNKNRNLVTESEIKNASPCHAVRRRAFPSTPLDDALAIRGSRRQRVGQTHDLRIPVIERRRRNPP